MSQIDSWSAELAFQWPEKLLFSCVVALQLACGRDGGRSQVTGSVERRGHSVVRMLTDGTVSAARSITSGRLFPKGPCQKEDVVMSHFSSLTARTPSPPEGLFLSPRLILILIILIRMLYFGMVEVAATVEQKASGESLGSGGPDAAAR